MEYGRDPYKLPLPPVFPAAADDTEDEEVDVGGVVHCKKYICSTEEKFGDGANFWASNF